MAERAGGERGAALVGSLLALMVMLAIAGVVVSLVVAQTRGTAIDQRHQGALHAAEAGAERILARARAAPSYDTGQTWPSPAPLDVRAWAIAQRGSAQVMTVPGGEAYGLRPRGPSGPVDFVLGVATLGGRTRVVRVAFSAGGGSTVTQTMLTGTSLSILNGGTIGGTVHTNGNLALRNSPSISGSATAAGTYGAAPAPAVGAGSGGGRPQVSIPVFTAAGFYSRYTSHPGRWVDLCPDGTVRLPSPSGPCQNPTVAPGNLGLRYDAPTTTWVHNESGLATTVDTVYYVHRASMRFAYNGGQGNATILASADPADGGRSGNVTLWNNGNLQPVVSGVLLVADRDLYLRNQFSASGFVGVGETFWIQNNLTLTGAIVARGLPDTPQSLLRSVPPDQTSGCQDFVGNQTCNQLNLTYAAPPLTSGSGTFTVGTWQEL